MAQIFDKFPSNMGETLGKIERNPFTFNFTRFEVWRGGQIIDADIIFGTIKGTVFAEILFVNVKCERISKYTLSEFSLWQISTNNERVMWSKDIFGNEEKYINCYPDIISLFYQLGILSKMSFAIRNPGTLIEFFID
jgi:hypothetical protein